jgi:hypothetical protein
LKNRILLSLSLIASLTVAMPVIAQPLGPSVAGAFRSEARVSSWSFGNFLQVSDPALEQDVRAVGLELRGAWHPTRMPFELYAHVNYLNWDAEREDTYGVRVGAAGDNESRNFNIFLERAENRATFDVGDVVASAAVTTLSAEYSRRFGNWQPGIEATYEDQRIDVASTGLDNYYAAAGVNVRYRGFGRRFSPEVGFVTGSRVGDDDEESYDDQSMYAQLVFIPVPRFYLSVRYRDRVRDYTTPDSLQRNFGREDDRPQWNVISTLKMTSRLTGILYYSNEDARSSLAGRDFQANVLILFVAVKL